MAIFNCYLSSPEGSELTKSSVLPLAGPTTFPQPAPPAGVRPRSARARRRPGSPWARNGSRRKGSARAAILGEMPWFHGERMVKWWWNDGEIMVNGIWSNMTIGFLWSNVIHCDTLKIMLVPPVKCWLKETRDGWCCSFLAMESLVSSWIDLDMVQCEAPGLEMAWKVGEDNSNFTMVYGCLWYANNELVTGANPNQQTSLGGLTL